MSREQMFSSMFPPMFARRSVGPHTVVRLGVGVVIRDVHNQILLEQRADCGWWGLPGGGLEIGESVTQTAVREVKEETGLTINIVGLIGIYSEPEERIVTYPDTKDGVQLIDVVVEGKIRFGELVCSDESLELRFFSPDDLPNELIPPSRQPVLDVYRGVYGKVG